MDTDHIEWRIRSIGEGYLDGYMLEQALEQLRDLDPDKRMELLLPYVSDPGPCDPPSLLRLMRVLAAGDEAGAQAVLELASDPGVRGVVREEADAAIERERPDLLVPDETTSALVAEERTLTFHATRFGAETFVAELNDYAERQRIPFEATIGSGVVWREVDVTITARPAAVAELIDFARSVGRVRAPGDRPWFDGLGDFGGGGGGDGGGGGG